VQDTADGLGVGEHASHLAHGAIIVDSLEFTGIQISIPVRHVDDEVIILRTGVIELGEEATRMQVMVILIDLAKGIADLEMSLEVIHPVAFGAVDGDSAVRTLKMRMSRGRCVRGILPGFGVMRRDRGASLLVAWVRAESVLLDELGALADSWRRRVRERVEQVGWFQGRVGVDGGPCCCVCSSLEGRGLRRTAGLSVDMFWLGFGAGG